MNIRKILSTILVVIWMFTIFCFSNQQGTGSSNTSKNVSIIIVNILDIKQEINEELKEELVNSIEPYIRKIAHFTIYMVGGILLINAAYAYKMKDKNAILCACIIGVIYAASDEIHQLFVLGRSGRIVDVIIDSLGIFTGVVVYLIIAKTVNIIVDKLNRK